MAGHKTFCKKQNNSIYGIDKKKSASLVNKNPIRKTPATTPASTVLAAKTIPIIKVVKNVPTMNIIVMMSHGNRKSLFF